MKKNGEKKQLINQAINGSKMIQKYESFLRDIYYMKARLIKYSILHSFTMPEEDLQKKIKTLQRYVATRIAPLLKLKEGEVMGEYTKLDGMIIATNTYTEINRISTFEIEAGFVSIFIINEEKNLVTRKRLLLNTGELVDEDSLES